MNTSNNQTQVLFSLNSLVQCAMQIYALVDAYPIGFQPKRKVVKVKVKVKFHFSCEFN